MVGHADQIQIQILEDAVEMVSALKDIAYTRTITKMGEDFMTDV